VSLSAPDKTITVAESQMFEREGNVFKLPIFERLLGRLSTSVIDTIDQSSMDPSSQIESLETEPDTQTLLPTTSVIPPTAILSRTAVPTQTPVHPPSVVLSPMDSFPPVAVALATTVTTPTEAPPPAADPPPMDLPSQAQASPFPALRQSPRDKKNRSETNAFNDLSMSRKRPRSSKQTLDEKQSRDSSSSVKLRKRKSMKGRQTPCGWDGMTDLQSFMCICSPPSRFPVLIIYRRGRKTHNWGLYFCEL